uniref:Uncharacterized protein n=1 Tax=Anser brachyrhynchus TaxID=132585 RepID=A0A8B9I0F2_9AVES
MLGSPLFLNVLWGHFCSSCGWERLFSAAIVSRVGWVSVLFRLEAFALKDSNKTCARPSSGSCTGLCCPVNKAADLFCVPIPGEGEGNVPLPETAAAPAGSEGLHLPEIHIPWSHSYPIPVDSRAEMAPKANEGREHNGKLGVGLRSK